MDDRERALQGALQLRLIKEARKEEERQLRVTQASHRTTMLVVGALGIVGIGAVAYTFVLHNRMKKKYGPLIKLIDNARSSGQYRGPSGMATCVAYEHGAIGSFLGGFTTKAHPEAIVLAYYTSAFHTQFLGEDNGVSGLIAIKQAVSAENDDVLNILCGLFAEGDVTICENICSPMGMQTQDGKNARYIQAAVGGASTGAGMMMMGAAGGPVGLGVGAVLMAGSIGFSMYNAHKGMKEQSEKCEESLKHCINVFNTTCD